MEGDGTMTRYCLLSDQHGYLPEIEPCDYLLIAGDCCPVTEHNILFQKRWLLKNEFMSWLKAVPAQGVIMTWGNHDLIADRAPKLLPDFMIETDGKVNTLSDQPLLIENYRKEPAETSIYYGFPHQPRFGNWAFNQDEDVLEELLEYVPEETEILISHGPPYGYGDYAPFSGKHVGSKALRYRMMALPNLKLLVCGHCHSGNGEYKVNHDTLTIVISNSHVSEHYEPINKPIYLDI